MDCEYTLNSESNSFSWKGLAALIVILIIVSIIAFLLSSIEGFLAGVVVIFIGFLISFFRDDLKRALGLSAQQKEPTPVTEAVSEPEEDPLDKLDKMIHLNMDKKITKERQSLAKTIAKYNEKPKKQQKLGLEIVKEASALLALLDQAKSQAIQSGKPELVAHYEQIQVEIEGIREKYRQ
jgi:hypothetical protein